MAAYFRERSTVFIRTDAGTWEEVMLLSPGNASHWAVLDHTRGVRVIDFSQISSRPMLNLAEPPSDEELATLAAYGKELVQAAPIPQGGMAAHQTQLLASELPASELPANHNPDLMERAPDVQPQGLRGRGRGRSASQSRALSEPANPQSGSLSGRSEQDASMILGHGFEYFTRQAIREFVWGKAEVIHPQEVGILEADLILRFTTTVNVDGFLPRQFVWHSQRFQNTSFEASSIIVFEMKSSARGVVQAQHQLRERLAGLAVDCGTTIHQALIINCDSNEALPDLDVHLVYTRFSLVDAFQDGHPLAGFKEPLHSYLPRNVAFADDRVRGNTLEVPQVETVIAASSTDLATDEAELPDPPFGLQASRGHGRSDGRSWQPVSALRVRLRGDSRGRASSQLKLHHLLGEWTDDRGSHVQVKPSRRVVLTSTEGARRMIRRAHMEDRGNGNFTCGPYRVNVAESNADRIVWTAHETGDTRVWQRP